MLSYIEISKENLLHNFKVLKTLVKPGVKMTAVIKANAYGHGQNEVAKILENSADYFQVDDAEELKLLREVSQKSTLVLGYVAKNEMKSVIENAGIMGVYEVAQILAIEAQAKAMSKIATVHVKIDAFLGRQGVLLENVQKIVDTLKVCENVKLDGIYSHFANIEDTSDFSHAQKQIDAFNKAHEIFKQNGFEELNTHISASSGVMVYENSFGNSTIVRPGISVYGLWPSEDLKNRFEKEDLELKPVLHWVTHVAQVKTLPANYSIGYGLTYITSKPTKIVVVPQGYSDGYDRGLSNVGQVLIGGTRCRVLGRIAMNMFVADVSHLAKVNVEDEIVLLGQQGNERITAEEIAQHLGTINYEIIARISPLLARVVK